MNIKEILLFILGSIVSLGVLAGGIGYLISKFRSGSKEEKAAILSSAETLAKFWEDQATGYKSMMAEKDKSNDEKFLKLTTELGEIRGQLLEKDKQVKQYLDILQNRDPETKKFNEYVIKAIENQTIVNQEMIRVLAEIHSMAKDEHERDFKVVTTSSITKEPHQ